MPDTYSIYQIPAEEKYSNLLFMTTLDLKFSGDVVYWDNYELVYSGALLPGESQDSLWEKFNINHPADYKGRSMSVSDVVVISREGEQKKAYYVDGIGFKELTDFLPDAELKPSSLIAEEKNKLSQTMKNSRPRKTHNEAER